MRADTWANAIARRYRSSERRCVGDERSWLIRSHHIMVAGTGGGSVWLFATSAEPSRFQLTTPFQKAPDPLSNGGELRFSDGRFTGGRMAAPRWAISGGGNCAI